MNATIRRLRRLLVAALLCAAGGVALAAPPSLAMIGFELLEDHPDGSRDAEQQARLKMIDAEFRALIAERGLYRPVDLAPQQALVDKVRNSAEFVFRCVHCKSDLAAGLGSDYVAVGWVQKVSNLILNVNIEIIEAASGRVALVKSVDLRGNNDESWLRGVRFMVRDMAEKRALNPGYGL
ncbi:DUF3280 domain-containing protein [Thauera mechernichensis]|uniref:DUF3280 domain-containing protein n=1 Tax=Thauera mechernichensis TaxID=82788 RepID=A0ABW3WK34_9RHOO|nr:MULTISPECIES: DUF3280 domain-containing protein [Thauera]ENO94576.1 hypothetical protein C662_00065 [Thauera sp. 28]MDG3066528.1 DUF3280 domain-containing protein [Thauera mechernichensis]WBL65501.1 DUF3280 domain-containing protein [Thauera sp. WB-2]HAY09342.1 DUF2380 domain-containing protein [Thauera sp.]HNR60571.1 DUF3280 domain-containing protein [Thauera sp.]